MRTDQEWISLFQKWETSGCRQEEFCRIEGVKYSEFCTKRSALIQKGLVKSLQPSKLRTNFANSMPFIPIGMANAEPSKPLAQTSTATMIELQLPHGIILRIPYAAV